MKEFERCIRSFALDDVEIYFGIRACNFLNRFWNINYHEQTWITIKAKKKKISCVRSSCHQIVSKIVISLIFNCNDSILCSEVGSWNSKKLALQWPTQFAYASNCLHCLNVISMKIWNCFKNMQKITVQVLLLLFLPSYRCDFKLSSSNLS